MMPREDHKDRVRPHAPVLSSISHADIAPRAPYAEGDRLNTSRMLALNAAEYSIAKSRLITELRDQRYQDWVSLAPLAAVSSNQGV